MKHWHLISSSLVVHFLVSLVLCQQQPSTSILLSDEKCPPWFFYNFSLDRCECFDSLNRDVRCTDEGALLRFGRCMTYQEGTGSSVSFCPYFLVDEFIDNVTQGTFIQLPGNVSELNDYMCGPLHRKGELCNECIDGFGPSLTSVGYQCSNCIGVWYGVPLYLFLEFVPITIFYVIILVFRINVTSAPMTSFILFSQIIVFSFGLSTESQSVYRTQLSKAEYSLFNILIALYGIWNLDFFRYVIPPFCVSANLKVIHIFFTTYVSAFYPVCLIAITWTWIELLSRNFKPLIWIWRKTHRCFSGAKWNWDKKRTIIDTFATFLLLSYSKLLLQSLVIIAPTRVQSVNITGFPSHKTISLDPSTDFFSREHLPFAIVAILIFVIFVVLPALVLAFYPFKIFRTLLRKVGLLNHHKAAFHLFVEKFYSCYRDGLDGGKDMRSFASLYFFLRFIIVIFHQSSIELVGVAGPNVDDAQVIALFIRVLLFAAAILLIAIVRPYKEAYMNILDTLILSTFTLILFLTMLYLFIVSDISSPIGRFFFYTSIIVTYLPQLGFFVYLSVKFYRSKRPIKWIQERCTGTRKTFCCTTIGESRGTQTAATEEQEESLPDRMVHPEQYYLHVEAVDNF